MAGFPAYFHKNITNKKKNTNPKKTSTSSPSRIATSYAKRLQAVWIAENRKDGISRFRYPLVISARFFDQLIKETGSDLKRVEKTLDWFCKHHNTPYVPKASIGKVFYAKFISIEEARKRWKQDHPYTKIRPEFRLMAQDSFGVVPIPSMLKHWSPEFVKLFPSALQSTHDNYKPFADWVWENEEYMELYGPCLSHPMEFTVSWWKELGGWFDFPEHRKINPMSLIFDFSNKRTKKWIREWCVEHSFQPETGIKLVEEFQNDSSR